MNREELKSKIPYGYVAIIAERAGVSTKTAYSFINGKSDNLKVELAALEIVGEIDKKKKDLLDNINHG